MGKMGIMHYREFRSLEDKVACGRVCHGRQSISYSCDPNITTSGVTCLQCKKAMQPKTITRMTDVYHRYNIPRKVMVQVDSREKIPVLFPFNVTIPDPERVGINLMIGVQHETITMNAGDYRLKEFPNCCVVERKYSQLELFKNIEDSIDSIRQAKAFRKLSAVEHPVILIEAGIAELLKENKQVANPEALVHKLSYTLAKYGFQVLWVPGGKASATSRRKLGTFMVHLMLAYALKGKLDIIPELI